jgi:hypothetical protein
MLTVLTVSSALVLTLIILVPVRPSRENVTSMPSVRRNVCARRSRPASARGFFAHAVALEMSVRACSAHKRKRSDALPIHIWGTLQKASADKKNLTPNSNRLPIPITRSAFGSPPPIVETRFPIVGKVWITKTYDTTARVLKDSATFTLRKEGGGLAGLRSSAQLANNNADYGRSGLAVEEFLRFVSPVQFSKPRFVGPDMELDGVRLKKGDRIMAMVAAANMEPQAALAPAQIRWRKRHGLRSIERLPVAAAGTFLT